MKPQPAIGGDDRIERGYVKRFPKHVVGRVGAAEPQVFHDRSADQRRALRQVADDSRQVLRRPRRQGSARNADLPGFRNEKPARQIEQGGLS